MGFERPISGGGGLWGQECRRGLRGGRLRDCVLARWCGDACREELGQWRQERGALGWWR